MITPLDMAVLHAAAFAGSRPWSADEFTQLLKSKFCFALGDSRCFALIRIVADEAELLTIATHPDFQRQGLARDCMAAWHEQAHAKGAVHAFLEVAADNTPACAMYTGCGYNICGVRQGYYRRAGHPRVDALTMRCLITQH